MKLLKSWDEQERKAATRIAGLICAALTIFIFIAGVSYLFNWQEDMSLIQNPDAMSADQKDYLMNQWIRAVGRARNWNK